MALARAIATRPDILLFDEPLSNLDAKLRERVRIEIRELQRRLGITTLYVTHDQAEALAISDRIVVMNKGRIEQVGDPDTIYRRPRQQLRRRFRRRRQHRRRDEPRRRRVRDAGRPLTVAGDATRAGPAREAELAAGGHEDRARRRPGTSSARECANVDLPRQLHRAHARWRRPAPARAGRQRRVRCSEGDTLDFALSPTASGWWREPCSPAASRSSLLILPGAGFIFLFLAAAIAHDVPAERRALLARRRSRG